ncbi:hypothetical protein SAMN02746041_02072 [Desulfacinum hydrothermale DSM 13146]|uniref:Uncharacterized protein n=1 Tax=Desulfacinum hydrothermale DSM 13146 TaxID=1121390 RepID=A0A1W1XM85_9BACT|nr:hypothetical protein [Desulfacinum hydrothermale]SMC24638.1 hypothetical protein SAMN02746041_02072 [Desulfacinum hydrothermale DSM 13146]
MKEEEKKEKPEPVGPPDRPLLLYMLHCGLDGKLLQKICARHGLRVEIRQFPREQAFAYHLHPQFQTPDLILIRGHFIQLVHECAKERHIPYVVVSSKLKYGNGQPVFIHADKGYGSPQTLALYHAIAERLKEVVTSRSPYENNPATDHTTDDPSC